MIDVLVIGAHPDDCEMFMGGTLLYFKSISYKVGICDLTRGEAGTYGSIESRKKELEKASAMLSLDARITLDIPDGNVRNNETNRLKIIEVIRKYRPELVFSFIDHGLRHPDHLYCGQMVKESCYLSGLKKIETQNPAFRPSAFIGFPELLLLEKPDFVIDITGFREKKSEVIKCYDTQVIEPGKDDSQTKTFIRSNRFWEMLQARDCMAGAVIGTKYGEPFYSTVLPQIKDPLKAFRRELK